MTHEIFNSEAPWAMALTLMPFRARVLKNLPAMPGVFFMFSPTMATRAISFSIAIWLMFPELISWRNSFSMASLALSLSLSMTAKVIEYSQEAGEMRTTLTLLFANAPNNLLDIPVTPTIPEPRIVTRLIFSIEEIPLIDLFTSIFALVVINVPLFWMLKVFLI